MCFNISINCQVKINTQKTNEILKITLCKRISQSDNRLYFQSDS